MVLGDKGETWSYNSFPNPRRGRDAQQWGFVGFEQRRAKDLTNRHGGVLALLGY